MYCGDEIVQPRRRRCRSYRLYVVLCSITLHFDFIDLLPFYAILRSIPNKLLGVIAMFSAILILLVMPFADLSRSRGIQFKPLSKAAFFLFLANFLVLLTLGAKHVESPFIEFGQISTVLYFAHFLIIVPSISLLENSLVELALASPTHPPMRERSGVKHEGTAREGMVRATVISTCLGGYSSYLLPLVLALVAYLCIDYLVSLTFPWSWCLSCDAPRP